MTVLEKRPEKRIVLLDTRCTDQKGEEVLTGTATVIAPDRSIEWPLTRIPDVSLRRHDRYESFVARAKALPMARTAIVHPCSPGAIQAAIEARDNGLLDPLLIGPEARYGRPWRPPRSHSTA